MNSKNVKILFLFTIGSENALTNPFTAMSSLSAKKPIPATNTNTNTNTSTSTITANATSTQTPTISTIASTANTNPPVTNIKSATTTTPQAPYRLQADISILENPHNEGSKVVSSTIDGKDVQINTIYQMFNLNEKRELTGDFFYFTTELNKGPQAKIISCTIEEIQVDKNNQMFVMVNNQKFEVDLLVSSADKTLLAVDISKEDLTQLQQNAANKNTSVALKSAAFLTKLSVFASSSAKLVNVVGNIAQAGTSLASKLAKDAGQKAAFDKAATVIGTVTDKAVTALNQGAEKAATLADQARKNQEAIDLAAKAGQALAQATVDKVINPLIDKQIAAGTASESAIKIRDKLDGFNAEQATNKALDKANATVTEGQRIVDVSQKAADSISKDVTNANKNSGNAFEVITSLTNAATTAVSTIPTIFDKPSIGPAPTPDPVINYFRISMPDNYDFQKQLPKNYKP